MIIDGLEFELQEDGSLTCEDEYMSYRAGDAKACLDGDFSADQLEAIALHMRAHDKEPVNG